MKDNLLRLMVVAGFFGLCGCSGNNDPAQWNTRKINEWFDKGEWLNGWAVKPDSSINRKAFIISYFKQKERWDKAFKFLKESDFSGMELKTYIIDGDNVYAPVSEYLTKNPEDARYESHQKYIDIQYVASGRELIGYAPSSNKKDILESYDPEKDIEFMTVTQGTELEANPEKFFIFFPDDLHCPGIKDGENSTVRKVVVKVRID